MTLPSTSNTFTLSADPHEALLAELTHLEQLLHQPAFRRDATAVAALLADDFREYGSSGRIFDKPTILAALAAESLDTPPIESTDFTLKPADPKVALLTYRSTRAGTSALRSSLWVYRHNRWQLLFHQGTPQLSETQ